MNDYKTSISEILKERLTSPLYGTFTISWVIWNWDALYVLMFSGNDYRTLFKISLAKHIITNNINHALYYPIISTIAVITVLPLLSTGAFWLTQKYNGWKANIKNRLDKKVNVDIEKHHGLKLELRRINREHAELIIEKEQEIADLKVSSTTIENEKKALQDKLIEVDEKLIMQEHLIDVCHDEKNKFEGNFNKRGIDIDRLTKKLESLQLVNDELKAEKEHLLSIQRIDVFQLGLSNREVFENLLDSFDLNQKSNILRLFTNYDNIRQNILLEHINYEQVNDLIKADIIEYYDENYTLTTLGELFTLALIGNINELKM